MVDRGVIEGKGLVARAFIAEGEVIARLDPGQPLTPISEILTWSPERQEAFLRYAYQCSETHYVDEHEPDRCMNHSCDPNTWWGEDDTMIARRDIQPGEEITYDYATTEISVPFAMTCLCGSAQCRGTITHEDYRDPAWQARFGDHLPRHTRRAIAALRGE